MNPNQGFDEAEAFGLSGGGAQESDPRLPMPPPSQNLLSAKGTKEQEATEDSFESEIEKALLAPETQPDLPKTQPEPKQSEPQKEDPFNLPELPPMAEAQKSTLGEMASADPITSGNEEFFEEFLKGGTPLTGSALRDSEVERSASDETKPWYETAQGFDAEIKPFGQQSYPLSVGASGNAMSDAFPNGLPNSENDPVDNLGNSLTRGWKMAQKAFSFSAGAAGLPGQLEVQAELQKDIDQIPRDQATKQIEEAVNSDEPWQAVKDLVKSQGALGTAAMGAEIVANLGTESGAMFLPGTLALSATRMGAVPATFINSFSLEYSSAFTDLMRESGVDITDPDAMEKALQDEQFVKNLRQASLAKAIPVAVFDALTGGWGGKLGKGIYKNVVRRLGKNSIGRVTGYVAAGAGTMPPAMGAGMSGEAIGQSAQQGVQANQWGEEITANTLVPKDKFGVLAEGIGEVGGPLTASLMFETIPGLKKQVTKPDLEPMSEYLRQVGAPQTADALAQSGQVASPEMSAEEAEKFATRVSQAPAYAGRTDFYPQSQVAAEEDNIGEGLTDFSRLAAAVESVIKGGKSEKGQTKPEEAKPTGKEAKAAEGETQVPPQASGEPETAQQGGEAGQASLVQPAAASQVFKYERAADYIADWYFTNKRPSLIDQGLMSEKQIFPEKAMTTEEFAIEAFRLLEASGIEVPKTTEDATEFFRQVFTRVKSKVTYEEPETGGGGEPPEKEDPISIDNRGAALDFLGSAIQNLTRDESKKPPKLKQLSGKNVDGEITIPQESDAYVQMLNEMPEAPGESAALVKADQYFRSKVNAMLKNNPKLQSLDLTRIQNAARLRLQRQIRKKYQQLRRRGSLTESQAAERFVSDVLPRINSGKVFGSVYRDYGRKLARRSNAKVGLETTASLDAPFAKDGSLTLGDVLEDKSDAEQDEQVFADIGRNARNAYFNSIQGDIAKNLVFRAMMNLRPGADLSQDAGRLRKIQDALEASGEKVDFAKLQKLAAEVREDFLAKVSARVNADYERYQSTGQLPDLVAGPESLKYLTSGRETVSTPVTKEDIAAHDLVNDMVEQFLGKGMLTEQQAIAIQDILDENQKKTGAIAAMRELQAILSASAVSSKVREPVTRVVSNNPEITDQTPDGFVLMNVQKEGASMIYNAYLRGRRGVLLADTAGLGKTRTALAAARMVSDHVSKQLSKISGEETRPGKIIYITESRELIDSAAGGAKAQLSAGNIPSDRVYFKTYDDYSKGKIDFEDADVIIFDEAQNLKNPESERARLAKIGSAFHIYVSATPADKIKSVRYFLPRITGRPSAEIENSLNIAKDKAEVIASYLELAGENYAYIRREPVQGLPAANVVNVDLPEALMENLKAIDDYHQSRLDALSEKMLHGSIAEDQVSNERLKILADRKRSLERYLEMNKTEEAYNRAKDALASGRQVLIFGEAVNPSSFPELGVTEPVASALEMLKARFEQEGIGVAVIYGEGGESMVADINDFMRGNKKVALLTPYKGGAGLNLDDQTGERPRTVINMTINEAADKDEQMRSRAGGRLSSKSDVEYLEIHAPQAETDRARRDLREKKQRILKVTQGADPGTRDPNQMLLEFQDVIETNKKPVLRMPDVDPTLRPVYSDTAKTRERLSRQLIDDRISTLRAFQRNAVTRFAGALDELGFRNMRLEFAEYSGKAAWTDWTRGSFNTIYINPARLAESLDVVASNEGDLGGLFMRAVGLEEVHHNQVYELVERMAKQIFEKQIAAGEVSSKEAFRQVYTLMLRGVYDEMSPAMRSEIQSKYKTASGMSPEMTAMEFLRSVYQELKLEYTTEDFNTEERRRALARKLDGVPRDGMVRMWLELLRQSVITLLRKAQKTFAQAPILSNMLDATDNMIQYLTDNGPPFSEADPVFSGMIRGLRETLGIESSVASVVTEAGEGQVVVRKSGEERLSERISEEVRKPVAAIDGVLLSGVPSSTRGLSGRVYSGQYAWVKADKLQASHLPNFGVNPKYPFLNTRDYSSSIGDQDKVLNGAANFQPEMFVTNSQSANGGLQTVMRGKRSGDFYLAAGNGRHLIGQLATARPDTGPTNLRDMVDLMAELANKEGIPLPENVYEYRLVKVLDMEVDESNKGAKSEIEEVISDLNDGGGRQVSALGKSEQDLPAILGNENLKERLEKFAIGERELTPNTASEFVKEAVALKAVNQLERGFLAESGERMSALAYVRYLLTRAYSSPAIPMTLAGKNPQVVYAQEVMSLNDNNWAIVSGLLRTNALSEVLGPKGKALKAAVDQLIFRLVTQPGDEKNDFLTLLKSFKDRPDELMTLMGTPEEIETQRKTEQLGDLLETQLAKQINRKTGRTRIDVAKSRMRMLRLIRAMGDHLYSSYQEKKADQKGSMSLDLGDSVEDGVEYMLQVIRSRIASNPQVFDQEAGDEDYEPAAASEVDDGDFEQPATADEDPDSEENRALLDPVINDAELKPENLVWQAWKEEGDVDFGFKSRIAYNRLLTYLDQAGYGKYLRFRKILESMAQDEAWVEEMGKRIDEEAELRDLMEKAAGKSVTSRMERLKMGIPSKEETFEVMRLTNVYAKDGRVAQLIEPILGKIDYPKVSSAVLNQRDEAVAMLAKAQQEVERLVKAKEYKILRENPRFAAEAGQLLEEINEAYQKYITKNVSKSVYESTTEIEKREKEEARARVAKVKSLAPKDQFRSVRIEAAIEQIKRNSIQTFKATPSINDRISGVLKSLEEVAQNLNALAVARDNSIDKLMSLSGLTREEIVYRVEDKQVNKPDRAKDLSKITAGRGDFLAKRQEIAKVLGLNEQIDRHRAVEQRLLLVLDGLESVKEEAKITAEEVVNEGQRLTKAELEALPKRIQSELEKRKFKEGFPIYSGTLTWNDPRPGKGKVVAKTLSQVVIKESGKPRYNTVLVSYVTESGEVPLPTYSNGIPVTRNEGRSLASAYYAKGGTSVIVTPQIMGDSVNIVKVDPVGMFLRGDKFYTPAPEPPAPKPKVKILELPMAQSFSKKEPEVNERGERWYEFTLDPENKRSHQRVYVRATNHLEAIRKAVEKLTEKGQTVLYKGKHYSQREPERTVRVPVTPTETENIAGLTGDELALRKAIRQADINKMRELIKAGKAQNDDYEWYAKQEAEAMITSMYEQGRELEDSEVISLAKEFGLIDISKNQKPDLRRLRKLRELATSRRTPKTMGVSRNVGRSGVIKDVSVNMALFGNQSSTKEVPAPEQTYKLPELPRKTSADVLQEIADTNGTTVEDIKRVNNMTGAALAPGASLLIPGTTRSVKVPDYNLVQEGPSLLKIAKKFGVTREELAKANNLPEDYIMKPGDEIIIPATKFRDTTKELVDRLFKERVYEAGPTMLRVNTPPPGIKIVDSSGEPMAATTIDPDEQRKKDLLAAADLPLFAKQEVKESQENGDSFMETLAKLKRAVDELKAINPEIQASVGQGRRRLFPPLYNALFPEEAKTLDKEIRGTIASLAIKYGRKFKFVGPSFHFRKNGKTTHKPTLASAMSKLQRLYKNREGGIPKFALQFVATYETRLDWDKITTKAELEKEALKVADKLLSWDQEKYRLTSKDKINWAKEWENLSTAWKDLASNENPLLLHLYNKIQDNFSVSGVLEPFVDSESQKEIILDYLNSVRRDAVTEWGLSVNENWAGKAVIYALHGREEGPYAMALVAGILQKSLMEKRRYGYVLPWRSLVMTEILQGILKNKMPPSSDLKKAYERRLNELSALKSEKQIDLGDGKRWIYVPNGRENPNIERSAEIVSDISCRGWCIRNQTYTKSQLENKRSYWFYQDNGTTELAVVLREEKSASGELMKVVVEAEDEFNEGHTVLRREHRRLIQDLAAKEKLDFEIDLRQGAPAEEMSAAQEWAEQQERRAGLEARQDYLEEVEEGTEIAQRQMEEQVLRFRSENPYLPGIEDPLEGEVTLREQYEADLKLGNLANPFDEGQTILDYETYKRFAQGDYGPMGENLAALNGELLRAFYNPGDDTMYFVVQNIDSTETAKRLFYHEATHGNVSRLAQTEKGREEIAEILLGAKELLIESADKILENTGFTLESLKKAYDFENEADMLGELLARYAENLAGRPQPSWFKELIAKISRWMKKHLGLNLSSEDVFSWLSAKMREPVRAKSEETLAREFFASFDGRGMWQEPRTKQKHTFTLELGRYEVQTTEAYGRKESIGKNLFKLFRKYGTLVYNGKLYSGGQLRLLISILDKTRGWSDPVRRIDYNEDGSIDRPAAATEIEPGGEEAERIYRARKLSQKKEGKRKVRGFVKTYGEDGEIDRDLRNAAMLTNIRYHVRTQPLRAEEAMDLIAKAGGAIAAAREIIAPETDNPELAAITANPIEFDNIVILNTILLKQLDKAHKTAKALGDKRGAAETMNLSLQLVGKQSELGTRLGRGLAAFAAYARLSPAGWRYFLTQQFEQARLEQINLLPEQFQKISSAANSSVSAAFEKVINKPEIKNLLDKIDELANKKMWEVLLKRARKIDRIAREAKGSDKTKRDSELDTMLENTKALIAMIKRQKDDMAALQLESAISEGVAAALMRGVTTPEETAQKLGITKEEVLENVEPAQDKMDEARQMSVDEIRAILPENMRDKPLNWMFDSEEPAAASTPEESIEDGDSVEEELAEAEEKQTDKMLKKFLNDFGKALRDRDKTEAVPQEKVNTIVRRILRENMQKARPELSLKRSKLSKLDRQTRAFTRFRKALSVWQELGNAQGDAVFMESVATSLNKMLPPGQVETVLEALEIALDQPYTKADLKAFLTLKNSNIRDFLFSRRYQLYELQAELIENLMVELRANGLTVEKELIDKVMKAIAKDLETTAQEEMKKEFAKNQYSKIPKLKVFKEESNELVKLALLQKLDPTTIFEAFAKKLKLDESSWSPSVKVIEQVQKKAEEIANDPDGPSSRRAIKNTLDLLDTIRKEVGFTLLDVFQSFFYANIIGGVKTVGTNIFAPVANAAHFALLSTSGKTRQGLVYAMQRVRQAFNQGLAEFLSVMATGDIAGRVTFLENLTGNVGKRKTGRQNMELFLDKDAKFYTQLPAFGWLVPLAKFWYGIGDKKLKLSLEVGIPKKLWDAAFKLLKTAPVKKVLGNVRTPEYPEAGVKAQVSIAGLGALIGRLYSGLDVFWTAVYSEIHAAMTAYEIAKERTASKDDTESGKAEKDIIKTADAIMGYDMGSKLYAARQITRNTTAGNTDGRDTPGYHPLAERQRQLAEEAKLDGLKRGTLEYRQQFYLNRIRNRAYSDQLPEERDIRERSKRRDKLPESEKLALDLAISARNAKVNKLIWESLFMGQWMAQVNEPYGIVGKLSKALENIVKRQGFRMLAFIQPFFSIVANVYTIWLNWLGAGYLKGKYGKTIEIYGEPKREKPDVMASYEKTSGIAGMFIMLFPFMVMLALRIFKDDDEEDEKEKKEPWFDVFGKGPEDIDQRKALEATGKWQKDSIKFGDTWIKIPVYVPFYLALKSVGDIKDYLRYDVPSHAKLLEYGTGFFAKFIGAAIRGPLDVPFVSGLKTAMDALNTENPNWVTKAGGLISRTIGGIAVPGIARELDQRVIDTTVREKSGGILATMLGNLPFLRSFNKPATNVLGEEIKFNNPPQGHPGNILTNYLEIFATRRAEVDPLFEVLMAKSAWLTLPPYRVRVMGVELNEDLADEWKLKRAEVLREEFRREDVVQKLWDMSPAEAQAYTKAWTENANRQADAALLEKYPDLYEGIEKFLEKQSVYGPRGVK